uniref:Uncharacterized protein n=1 Tax=Cannabis sativa TaxID=3483 RepID=A0A803Q254_CANSA
MRPFVEYGVAERRYCTLMDMVRNMMSGSNLLEFLWVKVLMTGTYILNRVPSKFVPKTPFELWIGRKPSLNHLHVWGIQLNILPTLADNASIIDKYIAPDIEDDKGPITDEGCIIDKGPNIEEGPVIDEGPKYNKNSNYGRCRSK